ncbi:MetQ/NlpA family ABC transporter substrate-binding protein [Terrisporobacter hibernicus]|uniref:Metal ABC transporter substrate-binding protein n=1 Tax=Terrisporobacter hibernicus TaxID=2813371 RepID=A0AAX2ZJV8_9FIRM|nr:MetQ/NlpA family ABC transporter substrate-binding protein [Terrisporobacter hibernicus]UEL49121.1 hypothetical protein JW646_06655 [Terrisporobacter hibernicus]
MLKKRILGILLVVFMVGVFSVGCAKDNQQTSNDDKKTIKIGTSSVSKDLAESGKSSLEKMGYEVEIVVFDDYVLPNDALVEGTLDANLYQHEPYMENYNESKGAKIVMLEPKLYDYYTGLYSVKADSLDSLPDGGAIGIAEDASNMSLQLEQLQEAGIIKLNKKPSDGEFFTVADIKENPHNYEFVQGDHMKYKNMDDYAIVIGTSNTMAEAGVDPTKNILKKFVDSKYTEGICVTEENVNTQWAKDIIAAYTSDEAVEKVPASSGFDYAGKK